MILNQVALANDVAPQFLEYIGMQDERFTVGKILYLFNIMDPAHPRFRSTVSQSFFIRRAFSPGPAGWLVSRDDDHVEVISEAAAGLWET